MSIYQLDVMYLRLRIHRVFDTHLFQNATMCWEPLSKLLSGNCPSYTSLRCTCITYTQYVFAAQLLAIVQMTKGVMM